MAEEKKQQATARAEQELTQLLHGKIDPDHVLHGTEFIRNFYQLMNREFADTDLRSALFASDMRWRNQILAKIDGMISKNLDIIKSGDDHSPMLRYKEIVRLARLRNGFTHVLGKWDEDKRVALRDEIAKAWRGWLNNTESKIEKDFEVAAALVMLHDDPDYSILGAPDYGSGAEKLKRMILSDASPEERNDPDYVSRSIVGRSFFLISDGVIFGPFLKAACQNAIAGARNASLIEKSDVGIRSIQMYLAETLQPFLSKHKQHEAAHALHFLGSDCDYSPAEATACSKENQCIRQVFLNIRPSMHGRGGSGLGPGF